MRFTRLSVPAFKRFREPFTLPLDNQGLVLVEGENRDGGEAMNSNGSGKSLAVVETILWCLFGKMARHKGKVITDEAVHPVLGAQVELAFETRGSSYTATRSRTPRGNPTFVVGGSNSPMPVSLDASKRADTVASLIGYDYNAFRFSVVIQGEDSLARAGFPAQMAVLESILRMEELSIGSERARKDANRLDRELAGLHVEVKVRRQSYDQAVTLLERIRATATADYSGEIQRLEQELATATWAAGVLPGLRDAASAHSSAYDRAVREASGKRAEWGAANRELQTAVESRKNAVCPTCKRPLSDAKDLESLDRQVSQLQKKTEDALKAFQAAESKTASSSTHKQAIEQEVRTREAEASGATRIQAQIAKVRQQQEEAANLLAAAEAQVNAAQAALGEAEEKVVPLENDLHWAQFWVAGHGRDGLQADVFSAAVPVLNEAAARYSQALTAGLFKVVFNPIRDGRSEDLIRIEGGEAPTYDGLSSGQKARADAIIALSLRDLARWRLPEPVNLAVYDEVFDHVDDAGLQVIARLLQEELREGGTTIVVTHNPTMKARFPGARVVRVVRQGGEAVVRYVS